VAVELSDEALAEAHNLVVALAVRVEIRSSLAATHRKAGKRILEYLLECEELERREGDLWVEADTPLVGSDGRIELDAIAAVDMVFSLVSRPKALGT